MALEIKESKGIFQIHGKVTSQNLGALKVYFDTVLASQNTIVVNLEYLKDMDASAALFFEKLYRDAAARNKAMTIVGRENQNISEIMALTKTNYILSPDRT